MNVLIKWVEKTLGLEAPKIEKKEEPTEDTKKDDKVEDAKDGDVEMKEDKNEEEKKWDVKADDTKKEEPAEGKSDEYKKEDGKKVDEEKKEDKKETASDNKSVIVELDEKTEEEPAEQDLVLAIQYLVEYITWEYIDAEYYLKEVKGKLALSMEDQNLAMT